MRKLNMRENKTNGLLITVCGLDGCGKTTMMNQLIKQVYILNIDFVKVDQKFYLH